jgi:pyruvate dehydrogenase E1 component beta subunit
LAIKEYREALTDALREEMIRDSSVICFGEDVAKNGGAFKVTRGLVDEFGPNRVLDTPISESVIAGAACGAALLGLRPVIEIMFIDFATQSLDMVVNQMAKIRLLSGGQMSAPVVLRTQGGVGRGSGAQHSQSLEAWYTHIPGLKVVMPATPYDAKGLLKSAIRDADPVIFIEHKMLYNEKGEVPEEEYLIPLGMADVKRQGTDITIFATSRMVGRTLTAAERLAEAGIDCEIVDPRTLVPLDHQFIARSVKKTGKLLIVQEACKRTSFASEVASWVSEALFDYLDMPVKILAGKNTPIPFNTDLERLCIPSVEEIVQAASEICGNTVRPTKARNL